MKTMGLIVAVVIVAAETYALGDNCRLFTGRYCSDFHNYYTNLSNVLVWLYFLLLLIGWFFIPGLYHWLSLPVVAMTVMLSILVTNLIYHFLLSGEIVRNYKKGTGTNPVNFTNIALHYGAPWLTAVYWVFWADKAGLVYTDALIWLLFPLVFVIYSLLHGYYGHYSFAGGQHYPYSFMDIDKLGVKTALRNVALVAVCFYLLGVAAVFIGHLLA